MRYSGFSFKVGILELILCLLPVSGAMAEAGSRQVIGYLENVHISDAGMSFRAKIDTGADSSSINAEVIKPFFRKGENWIRFRLTNWEGKTVVLERKLERYTRIKRKLALPVKRPVVKLGICLSGVEHVGEVSLAERTNFKYQMLVGRSYLSGHFMVDPEKTYLTRPACGGVSGEK